jgi:hypothetical protein
MAQMKPLYVEQNAYDVKLDVPIYRILRLDYWMEDIAASRLTHTRISADNWGDASENPLLNRKYCDGQTGGTFTLNGVVKDMFGSCWSLTAMDDSDAWSTFSYGKPSVRVQSTPRKLLTAVMHSDNPYYSLHHAIGKVKYLSRAELDAYFQHPDFERHLDSLGQGIALSLMRLHTAMEAEDEVRLLCNYMDSVPWVATNMHLTGEFLRVPFDWSGTVDGVLVGPRVVTGGLNGIVQRLQGLGISCSNVTSSTSRPYSG